VEQKTLPEEAILDPKERITSSGSLYTRNSGKDI